MLQYGDLREFIIRKMDVKSNYQPTMIRTILQEGLASKEIIDQKIRLENPEKKNNFASHEVYEVLVKKHKIVKLDSDGFKLNIAKPLTTEERDELIELCNFEILRLREIKDLLKKDVSQLHIDILTKFHRYRGTYREADQIYGIVKEGEKRKSPLPPDEFVDQPHYMHNLITGVFWLSGDKYALSIQLNPTSKWGPEIDREYPTLRIIYDFGSNSNYKAQIKRLENCYKQDIPIGLIFKTLKARNKILGLGKVISVENTKFTIDSYGMSKKDSMELKEKTVKEFDKGFADPNLSKMQEVNYEELLAAINFNEVKTEQNTLMRPELRKATIRTIIHLCDGGQWVIPRFQRYFNWNKQNIQDFLSSIFSDYYVGALLLWDVRKETELALGTIPVKGVNTSQKLFNDYIILDGQQRVTSLYYAIKAPNFPLLEDSKEKPVYFYIDFFEFFKSNGSENVIKPFYEKIQDEETFRKMLFPFYHLEHIHSWTNGLEDYLRNQQDLDDLKIRNMRRVIEAKLTHVYEEIEIPYVTLSEDSSSEQGSLAQVSKIFEKINSTGRQLNVFDLLEARLYKYNVSLKNLWDESSKNPQIAKYIPKESRYSVLPIYILHSIALCFTKTGSCKKNDILDIYCNTGGSKEEFENKWKIMTKYVVRAIDELENIKDGFGVTTPKLLPFQPMVPVLASLLMEIENRFKNSQNKCYDKLRNWYWTSVFSSSYSASAESRESSDFKEIMGWFLNDKSIPKSIENFRRDYISKMDLKTAKESSALYKGVLCLIALKGGYDFDKNRSVQTTKTYQKDHIFPKSKFSNSEVINSVLNMTMLTPQTNHPFKTGKLPSDYFEQTIREKYDGNEAAFLKILDSHFITKEAYRYMKQNNFEKFIDERNKSILNYIGRKIGAGINPDNIVTEGQDESKQYDTEDDIISMVKKGESDTLEFKSSLIWDYKLDGPNKSMWHPILKTITAFMNSDGGMLIVGVSDEGNVLGLEKDFQTLGKKKSWDEWIQHFINVFNEYIGKELISFVKLKKSNYEGREIAIVLVRSSHNPVYLDPKGKSEFYVRSGTTTQSLNTRETVAYIKQHWYNPNNT